MTADTTRAFAAIMFVSGCAGLFLGLFPIRSLDYEPKVMLLMGVTFMVWGAYQWGLNKRGD